MADEKLDQLLELQRQLIAAEAAAEAPAEASAADEVEAEITEWLQDLDSDAVMQRLREQFGTFLEGLDTDLKDTRPSTILLLLGAGFLMGRLSK